MKWLWKVLLLLAVMVIGCAKSVIVPPPEPIGTIQWVNNVEIDGKGVPIKNIRTDDYGPWKETVEFGKKSVIKDIFDKHNIRIVYFDLVYKGTTYEIEHPMTASIKEGEDNRVTINFKNDKKFTKIKIENRVTINGRRVAVRNIQAFNQTWNSIVDFSDESREKECTVEDDYEVNFEAEMADGSWDTFSAKFDQDFIKNYLPVTLSLRASINNIELKFKNSFKYNNEKRRIKNIKALGASWNETLSYGETSKGSLVPYDQDDKFSVEFQLEISNGNWRDVSFFVEKKLKENSTNIVDLEYDLEGLIAVKNDISDDEGPFTIRDIKINNLDVSWSGELEKGEVTAEKNIEKNVSYVDISFDIRVDEKRAVWKKVDTRVNTSIDMFDQNTIKLEYKHCKFTTLQINNKVKVDGEPTEIRDIICEDYDWGDDMIPYGKSTYRQFISSMNGPISVKAMVKSPDSDKWFPYTWIIDEDIDEGDEFEITLTDVDLEGDVVFLNDVYEILSDDYELQYDVRNLYVVEFDAELDGVLPYDETSDTLVVEARHYKRWTVEGEIRAEGTSQWEEGEWFFDDVNIKPFDVHTLVLEYGKFRKKEPLITEFTK